MEEYIKVRISKEKKDKLKEKAKENGKDMSVIIRELVELYTSDRDIRKLADIVQKYKNTL